jgi:hypothetical protein
MKEKFHDHVSKTFKNYLKKREIKKRKKINITFNITILVA